MITRRVVLWCAGGALFVVLGMNAASWIERLQMSANSVEALLSRESNRAQGEASRLGDSAEKQSKIDPDKLANEGWARIRAQFEKSGLPKAELESVISAAKEHLRAKKTTQGAYYVPGYVRRGWVKGEEVWLLAFGWGMRNMGPEPPGHYLVMAVYSEAPHKDLGWAQCK